MRLLLDTHAFLWFVMGDARLSDIARNAIEDVANDKFVSAGSLWEIAIKNSLGRLILDAPYETLIPGQLHVNGFVLLPIEVAHAARLVKLPFHHRDPFDRLLIAQAAVEAMPIVGLDRAFDLYGVKWMW